MKTFAALLLISVLSASQVTAQKSFDFEANKPMLIERALMQYFIILHNDRYDVAHLDEFCAPAAKGANLNALRQVAKLVPEDFDWTNETSPAITNTPFKPGSIFKVDLARTDGSTAGVQLVVSGTADKPFLLVHDHLKVTN